MTVPVPAARAASAATARLASRALAVLDLNDSLGDAVAFALQASLGSLAALWIAMDLQLDAPYWAASTVIITAQASRSQSLLKAVNRLLGTSIGACAGLVIVALFPQGWWSFGLAIAAWLALCTFLSCLFRALQSYAAALSGYTAVIVVTEQFGHPLDAFDTALSRGSAVFLGVTIYVTTALIFIPARSEGRLRRTFADMLEKVTAASRALRRGETGADGASALAARLMTGIRDFDADIEDAATDGLWRRGTKPAIRRATLGLADALLLSWALGPEPSAREGGARTPPAPDPSLSSALDRALEQARAGLALLETGRRPAVLGRVRRTLHRDFVGASYAALRTFTGVMAAFTFWVETRWPTGASFVLFIGVLCTLFAARPAPIATSQNFTIGTTVTMIAALVLNFAVLPRLDGFGELALALFPFLFASAFSIKSKTLSPYTAAINFLLLPTVGVTNQMNYDPPGIFNSVFAIFASCCAAIVIFKLLPPLSDRQQAIVLERWMAAEARTAVPRGRRRKRERRVRFYDRFSTLLGKLPPAERAAEFERTAPLGLRLQLTGRRGSAAWTRRGTGAARALRIATHRRVALTRPVALVHPGGERMLRAGAHNLRPSLESVGA